MEKPTPFINSSMLPQHRGQIVRIVGKVEKLVGNTLLIQTSDLGNVEVHINPDSNLSGDGFVEVIGKVAESNDSDTIREFTTVNIGENVDMDLVEQVVQIQSQYPHLFREV